jgi:hypothetical protein
LEISLSFCSQFVSLPIHTFSENFKTVSQILQTLESTQEKKQFVCDFWQVLASCQKGRYTKSCTPRRKPIPNVPYKFGNRDLKTLGGDRDTTQGGSKSEKKENLKKTKYYRKWNFR